MSDGEPTTSPDEPAELCVNCGTPMADDAKACPKCGVRRIPLGASEPPTAPPNQAPYAQGTYPTPGAYAQPPYPPGGYGSGAYVPRGYGQHTNNKAVTALVLGIVGLVVCQIASIFAIIIGKQAADEIRYSGGRQSGEGMATAGRILGWIGVAIFVIAVVAIVAITMLGTTTTPN